MEQFVQQYGAFPVYGAIVTLLIIIITYLGNWFRGLVIAGFVIGAAYYLFLASPSQKQAMDSYAIRVYNGLLGKNGVVTNNVRKLENSIKNGTGKITEKLDSSSKK